jgi:hypothetical protein
MGRENQNSSAGSDQNLPTKGLQIKYSELENVRFFNTEAEHSHVVRLQNEKMEEVTEWLEKYPDGINFDK